MFDFWSRCTKQPGHDDLHGRSVSIEGGEDEKSDSSTVRFSLDRFNYCRGLVATGYARISRYQIYFLVEKSSFGIVPIATRNARSSSSMHIFNTNISPLPLFLSWRISIVAFFLFLSFIFFLNEKFSLL